MDPLYPIRAWQEQEPQAICPSCGGRRGVRCLACRSSGHVPAARVCSGCHKWLLECVCPREPGKVLDYRLLSRREKLK